MIRIIVESQCEGNFGETLDHTRQSSSRNQLWNV